MHCQEKVATARKCMKTHRIYSGLETATPRDVRLKLAFRCISGHPNGKHHVDKEAIVSGQVWNLRKVCQHIY